MGIIFNMTMEILNNFSSIYCYISFIIGAVLMLVSLAIAAMGKDDVPRNKVHFYVTCELNYSGEIIRTLWLGKPYYTKDKRFASDIRSRILAINGSFVGYNLNYSDFEDMKNGEIREVFINLED